MQELVILLSVIGSATVVYATGAAIDTINGYFKNAKRTGDKITDENNYSRN